VLSDHPYIPGRVARNAHREEASVCMNPVVLVVEDEPAVRLVITRSLVARGYDVESVSDGANALRALAGQPVDLVVLDVNLPDKTGWDVARYIRQEIGPDLPIVVISAVTPRVARLREHGVAGVLQKPFPMESLLQLVARHTGQAPTRMKTGEAG
jgi:CheY-like chemotaxis protein